MKFTLPNASKFGWEGLKGCAYNSSDDFSRASAAYFEVTDKGHGKTKTTLSDRIYYVLEGCGEFVIDGEVEKVNTTDVIIVPKDTLYDYYADKGTVMKLFLVHTPAFDQAYEIKLKNRDVK